MQADEMVNGAAAAASHPVTVQVINQGPGIWGSLATGLITGLLTGGIALTGIWLTHRFTLKRERQAAAEKPGKERYFIATGPVFLPEQFAEECARVATDAGRDNDAPQPEREPGVDYPELVLTDVAGDWRALPALLMYRVRELPVLMNEARRTIGGAAKHDNPPYYTDYFRERRYQFSRLGLKAIILAKRLRKLARLPDTRLNATG